MLGSVGQRWSATAPLEVSYPRPVPFVVLPPGAVGLPDLGGGDHGQGVVEPSVARAEEAMPDLITAGHVDRGGAVVAGEAVLGREPVHVADLGQDPSGHHWPDAVQIQQGCGRGGDERSDLGPARLDLGVERADVGQVLVGELEPDPADLVARAQVARTSAASPARSRSCSPTSTRLGAVSPALSLTLGAASGSRIVAVEHEGQILRFPSVAATSGRWPSDGVVVVDEVHEQDRFVERVAAIDVGKNELKVCVRLPGDRSGRRRQEVRTYSSRTRSIFDLSDWPRCEQVELVVMEATGEYWKPPFYLLEDSVEC